MRDRLVLRADDWIWCDVIWIDLIWFDYWKLIWWGSQVIPQSTDHWTKYLVRCSQLHHKFERTLNSCCHYLYLISTMSLYNVIVFKIPCHCVCIIGDIGTLCENREQREKGREMRNSPSQSMRSGRWMWRNKFETLVRSSTTDGGTDSEFFKSSASKLSNLKHSIALEQHYAQLQYT